MTDDTHAASSSIPDRLFNDPPMITFFEDQGFRAFLPLTYSRPIYDMRCGIYTLRERVETLAPNVKGFSYHEEVDKDTGKVSRIVLSVELGT